MHGLDRLGQRAQAKFLVHVLLEFCGRTVRGHIRVLLLLLLL
jgi:hypothetical protein